MRKIDELIIHCSDSPDHLDIGVEEIRKWHTDPPRNWDDIGYHFVIRRDGTLEKGRDIDVIGAHCRGHNSRSLGVCLVGRDDFNPAQFVTLDVMVKFAGLFRIKVNGHYKYSDKTCPNFNVEERYESS